MTDGWRPLGLAVALNTSVSVCAATAQTVIVRNAPPRSVVELVLNTTSIGSVTVEPGGDATFAVDESTRLVRTQIDAQIYVDTCNNQRRVLLHERGVAPPPPDTGCTRKEVWGTFISRPTTTFLVDLGGTEPAIYLRQGPPPKAWLGEAPGARPPRVWPPAPTGVVLFGSAGFAQVGSVVGVACGNVTSCSGSDFKPTYNVGVAYWISRFVAAEASFMKPGNATATGGGDAFHFNSALDTDMVTIAGNIGAPVGPARIYGHVGGNHHRATFTTTQTTDDVTVTVNGAAQTIKGGTQTFEQRTAGWGWLFGGGIEVWMARSIAVYAEGGRSQLKGPALGGGEGSIDDHVTYMLAGARLRIGR